MRPDHGVPQKPGWLEPDHSGSGPVKREGAGRQLDSAMAQVESAQLEMESAESVPSELARAERASVEWGSAEFVRVEWGSAESVRV